MIAIVDYRAGNLHSVQKALEIAGAQTIITSDPAQIKDSEKIVFPGVGSFAQGMNELLERNLLSALIESIREGKGFLGICLGYQLLFSESEEGGAEKGLGVLRGKVVRFPKEGLKIPHMGWNQIEIDRDCPLFKDIPAGSYMYFVHSYYPDPEDKGIVATYTDYGVRFASAVWKDNIFGVQFHPEKSHKTGLKILENFIKC